jgi:hypothetical protein
MVVLGAFGLIVPIIPGILLLVLGFRLLFCFHQSSEDWASGVVHRWYGSLNGLAKIWCPTSHEAGTVRGLPKTLCNVVKGSSSARFR